MFQKRYDHKTVEEKLRIHWDNLGLYRWEKNTPRENTFVIDTPPPTVSGPLHMGHVYSYSHTDFIARYQSMKGKNVFYPIGFDDNGLPTERLVEKELGIKAGKQDRAYFINICKEIVKKYEEGFKALFRSMAFSFDWDQQYQTISDRTKKISQMSFIDLYNKGLVYKKYAPTFWDSVDQTAIAQAEIEDKERTGIMSKIVFKTTVGGEISIATTRPELLCACVAILYNPEDQRYALLKGVQAIVPVFGHVVPIIEDIEVEKDKGTGLVMCCTFGDIQDVKWWQRYNLELRICINKSGNMENAGFLNGFKVSAAREEMLRILKETNLILEQEEINRPVKCAERSGSPLEIIPSNQWYVSVIDQKEKLLEQSSKCNWHPEYMKVRLDNWIKGLNQDWCISRQRYFGVPFPVWYSKREGEQGRILLPDLDQLPVDPSVDLPKGYDASEVIIDYDIMDTWATSSLTPQISSLGINNNIAIERERHEKLFPADLRPQAHEIIRTWAFTTIVKSLYHQNSIPWHNIMISGWCLTSDKTKMSKSKGNTITPKKLLEEKSVDVVRYWAASSKLGADIVFSEEAFKVGNRLVNKLWNLAKFCSIHMEKQEVINLNLEDLVNKGIIKESLDIWIIDRIQTVIANVTENFENFDYWEAKNIIEDFFWKSFCDNYIEMVKSRLYNDEAKEKQLSAIVTVSYCISVLLKLFAPFVPHITEEIFQKLFPGLLASIHQKGSWPTNAKLNFNKEDIFIGEVTLILLELVRKSKSLLNISLGREIKLMELESDLDNISLLEDFKNASKAMKIEKVKEIAIEEGSLRSECGKYAIKIHL